MKEIELDLQIDPHRLDEEWTAQPALYHAYAAELADVRRDYEMAKAAMELTKAELDKSIRSDPEAYGLTKLTETALAATILARPEHKTAQKKLIHYRHRVDVTQAAVNALDHRKTALVKEVDLFLADYYSRPRASEGSRERMDEVEKKAVRRKGRPKKED